MRRHAERVPFAGVVLPRVTSAVVASAGAVLGCQPGEVERVEPNGLDLVETEPLPESPPPPPPPPPPPGQPADEDDEGRAANDDSVQIDADGKVGFEVLKTRAIYTPNPRPSDAQLDPAADDANCRVALCVDTSGKVISAEASGTESLHDVCATAVKKWRFKPLIVDGAPVQACSEVSFSFADQG